MDSYKATEAEYRRWFAADMTAGDAYFKRAAALREIDPDEASRLTDAGEAAYDRAERAWAKAAGSGVVLAEREAQP